MTARRALRTLALLAVIGLLVDQIVLLTALADDELAGVAIAPFDPPLFCALQRERARTVEDLVARGEAQRVRSRFDSLLGWCPRPDTTDAPMYAYDWAAGRASPRPFPRQPTHGTRRVGLFGCSFTRGDEVAAAETWAALLGERREDLELANLGMGGYGLDQAYLRLARDARALELDEVWLVYLPEASPRVLTHFPPLLRHWSTAVGFKPRFLLEDDGALQLVQCPVRDPHDYVRLLTDQRALLAALEHDHWIARAPLAYAPRGTSWTHRLAATRLALTLHEKLGRDHDAQLADPDHETYRILRALVLASAAEAARLELGFRLVVLPSRPDLRGRAEHGRGAWDTLIAELAALGVEVVDVAPALEDAGARTDDAFWMSGGHYAPGANRVVADALARAVR